MANVGIERTKLDNLATSISAKSCIPLPLKVDDMIDAVDGIPKEWKQVNFIDFDGELVASYTSEVAMSLTSLPPNPSHEGLTSQGWNWTLAQIKTQLTYMPDGEITVGQMYVTSSGKTEIDVHLVDANYLSPYLTIAISGTVVIDWGDGRSDSVTGTSTQNQKYILHSYYSIGDYTITIDTSNGQIAFRSGSNSYPALFSPKDKSGQSSREYSNIAVAVRLGTNVELAYGSFVYCYALRTITIPSYITSMGNYLFQNCGSLESATIPSNNTTIGSGCFDDCGALKTVSTPFSITSIEGAAFQNCTVLRSITISSEVTSLGGNAIRACRALKHVSLPDSITAINSYTFYDCSSLQSITLPKNVTSMASYTFTGCTSLYSIKIPHGATSIGTYAFSACNRLSSIDIPSSVTSIADYAFQNCYSLKSVAIPSGVVSIGISAFSSCRSLGEISIPNGVTYLNNNVLYSCYDLRNISIPNSVTSIGNNAIYQMYTLRKITIPSSVTSIGSSAFAYSYAMEEYHFQSVTPPTIGSNAFVGIPSDCKIYVPAASLSAYQTATNWSTYASYMVGE